MPLGCFATHSQDWKLLALSDTQVSCRCLIAFNKLSPGKRPSNLISAACSADQCLNRLRICWTQVGLRQLLLTQRQILTRTPPSMAILPQSRLPQASRAMLVIAHPDDETMFFTPTIQALIQQGCSVVILCLSIGTRRAAPACCLKSLNNNGAVCVHRRP